ncbi:hypothetical protein V8E54_010145 [Elaphomyces granulatus]
MANQRAQSAQLILSNGDGRSPNVQRVLDARTLKELGSQRKKPRLSNSSASANIRQTKEYKIAARKWTSTIVALPILLYTSWVLYERVCGGQSRSKHLDDRSRFSAPRQDENRG